ncbi:GNAT family N-acetyltransferase [Caulobacter sp. KR2-114]|uniref:GNAT family N-acetyltransferase n=1 Tax=Caulobacter sp. KR2-114 TaxID=3400912 RepID=UPI003C050FE0
MTQTLDIRPLGSRAGHLEALSALLVETVAGGGSVSFMHPLALDDARAFWSKALADADAGGRIVFGAFVGDLLAGTVTLLLDLPPNQPHRGEIAKMMTAVAHRGRGIASRLMRAAETAAAARGRTVLTLDTASEEGAAGLYEKLGWTRCGEIPDYAFKPHGGLTGTILYFRRLPPLAPAAVCA